MILWWLMLMMIMMYLNTYLLKTGSSKTKKILYTVSNHIKWE